jgi:hypothetical protein
VHNEEDRNPTWRGSNSLACEEEAVETKRKRRVSTGSPRSLHHQAAPIFSSEQTDEDAQCPCIHLRTVHRIHTYYPFRLCPQMRCRRAWHQGGRVVTAIPADVNSYVTPGNAPERAERKDLRVTYRENRKRLLCSPAPPTGGTGRDTIRPVRPWRADRVPASGCSQIRLTCCQRFASL